MRNPPTPSPLPSLPAIWQDNYRYETIQMPFTVVCQTIEKSIENYQEFISFFFVNEECSLKIKIMPYTYTLHANHINFETARRLAVITFFSMVLIHFDLFLYCIVVAPTSSICSRWTVNRDEVHLSSMMSKIYLRYNSYHLFLSQSKKKLLRIQSDLNDRVAGHRFNFNIVISTAFGIYVNQIFFIIFFFTSCTEKKRQTMV